jgi:predicted ATPase
MAGLPARALGSNGQLLVDLVELELVIGAQKPVAELPLHDAEYWSQMVVGRFLGALRAQRAPARPVSRRVAKVGTAALGPLKYVMRSIDS